jgi:tetratricopeptide (TPR) repeat protein
MNNRKRLILIISSIVIFLVLLFVIKFISDSPFRNQLPEYPDFKTVPKSLQEQITAAGSKAYRNPTANNLGNLGLVYYSGTYNDKATQCFQLAVKRNSNKWSWKYYLGYLNLEQGESKAAVENFRSVINVNPKNYLAQFYTAEACQNLGLTTNAKRIFNKIAVLNDRDFISRDTVRQNDFPLQTYAQFNLARIYMNSNQPDSAEIILKQLINNQITFGPAFRLLGNVYTSKGNLPLGTKYTIRANDLVEYTAPGDLLIDRVALISRSETYLLKQIDDALHSLNFNWELKLFDHALKYIPDSKYLISKALFGYLFLNYGNKALPYLDQHFKFYSDDFNEMMLFAMLLYDKGYKSQAMTYFNQAKKLKPGNSDLAVWLADRGRVTDAVILLDQQIKKDPRNIKTLTDGFDLYLKLGEKNMALTYLDTLKKLLPTGNGVKKMVGEDRKSVV